VIEGSLQMHVIKMVSAQPLLVRACPGRPTGIHKPLPQQQFRQPVPHPHQIGAGILTGPHQIAHRLDLPLRHPHCGDLTQA
jgi:hypothetical protein